MRVGSGRKRLRSVATWLTSSGITTQAIATIATIAAATTPIATINRSANSVIAAAVTINPISAATCVL